MVEQINRRSVLAAAVGSLSLSGCIEATAKQSWENADTYPDDESRNRKCEIRSSGPESGSIKPTPTKLGYSPYAYSLSGREEIHGTKQHYGLTISADTDVRIIGVSVDNAMNTVANPQNNTLDLPSESDLVENQTLEEGETYEETWIIPDGETHTIIVAPEGELSSEATVELELDCSYYLPLSEYKKRVE